MLHDEADRFSYLRDPWVRLAIVAWVAMTAAVCVRSVLQPHRQTVLPVWRGAGHHWLTSQYLYLYDPAIHEEAARAGFRYSPLAAALFTPFAVVPESVGNVVIRLLSAAAILAAVGWWLHRGAPLATTVSQRGMIFLLMAPLSLGTLNNGQVNLLMMALLIVCLTAASVERWNLAALCAAGAVLLKVYPLALVLLLGLVYPRKFLTRFLIALALLLALPFLLQTPDYVARQYQLWGMRLSTNDVERRSWPLANGYRDIWMLIRICRLPVSLAEYTRLQLAGAGACAVVALFARWRLGASKRLLLVLLVCGTSWMLLLGPSPESCTYSILAPVLAWWLVQSFAERDLVGHYPAVFAYGLLLLCLFTGTSSHGIQVFHTTGLHPLAGLIFTAGALASFAAWCIRGIPAISAPVRQPGVVRHAA